MARKAGLDHAEAGVLLVSLLSLVRTIPVAGFEGSWDEAWGALGSTDPDDVPYLACALAVDADAIWSHDPHFDAQDLVPRVTTADLVSLL